MRKTSFLVLLCATVLMVAAAVYANVRGDRAISPPPRDTLAFPGLANHLGDLAWMRVSHGSMIADFAVIGGHWRVVAKSNYPAAAGKVRRLLLGLADLTLVEPKTRRPALFSRLDLDAPPHGKATLVALQDRTGKTLAKLLIGKTRRNRLGPGEDGVYVRWPDKDRTWLARGSFDLPDTLLGWLDRQITNIPAAQIATVTLTGSDGTVLTLERPAEGAAFAVKDAPAEAKFKSQAVLAKPAGALSGLELDDVAPAAAHPVPKTGVATAAFTTFQGVTLTLRLMTKDKVDWVALSASAAGKKSAEAAQINDKVGRWSYAIPAARAALLRTKLSDLLLPQKGS